MKIDTRFRDAEVKPLSFYNKLNNPKFEGQTNVKLNGEYIVYYSDNNIMYAFKKLLN